MATSALSKEGIIFANGYWLIVGRPANRGQQGIGLTVISITTNLKNWSISSDTNWRVMFNLFVHYDQ